MDNVIFTDEITSVLAGILKEMKAEDVFVLTDHNVWKACGAIFDACSFQEDHIIMIQADEAHKSLESVTYIWSILSAKGARRNSLLINIGGGVVTDLGGFAASCFKRGMRCVNIPTTLLAQVDASVGGKTGINFGGLKNEIGTFTIPECVIVDNVFLTTLPRRQVMSGFAEMLKHALLSSEDRLAEIMDISLDYIGSNVFLQYIKESVAVKEAVVRADPKEKGIRKSLNFGHTVGHAIESAAIDRQIEIYHGDAVAYGMIAELYLSVKKMGFDEKHYLAIRKFIKKEYPLYEPSVSSEELYRLMLHDKKNEKDGVNFTLLREPGEFEIDCYCDKEEILEALAQLSNY